MSRTAIPYMSTIRPCDLRAWTLRNCRSLSEKEQNTLCGVLSTAPRLAACLLALDPTNELSLDVMLVLLKLTKALLQLDMLSTARGIQVDDTGQVKHPEQEQS